MDIKLDGVDNQYKPYIKKLIIDATSFIFQDHDNIPIDFVIPYNFKNYFVSVDPIYNNKDFNNIQGKCICNNGGVKIILNPYFYHSYLFDENELNQIIELYPEANDLKKNFNIQSKINVIIQRSTIYHELIHARNYFHQYETYIIDNNDYFLNEAFTLWDEYDAFKRTGNIFGVEIETDCKEMINILSDQLEFKMNCNTPDKLNYFHTLCYIFVEIEADIEVINNIEIKECLFGKYHTLEEFKDFFDILQIINDIPTMEQLFLLKNNLMKIYNKLFA